MNKPETRELEQAIIEMRNEVLARREKDMLRFEALEDWVKANNPNLDSDYLWDFIFNHHGSFEDFLCYKS